MTKQKKCVSGDDRIFDKDGYWLRAASVCIRDDNESEVLLVSSSGRPDSWIIPGGKVQVNEQPEISAMREALEEAGVVGRLGRCLGIFDNTDRKHRTRVFVLRVTELLDDYEEKALRKRDWFSVEKAVQLLLTYKPLQSKYLSALQQTRAITNGSNTPSQEQEDITLHEVQQAVL